ncbi:MAG: PRC-barrel domain-containing protein [archaeon]
MASLKIVLARQLGGKKVITNKGEEIGRVSDILVDDKTGKIEGLLIEPHKDTKIGKELQKYEKLGLVPYKSVFAVSDVVVVDESLLV